MQSLTNKVVLTAIAISSMSVTTNASAQIVAEYKFDGSGADSSGNGFNATLNNGATYGVGRFGQALSLDGINDFASVVFPNMSLSAFTVEAWINVPTYSDNVHYVSLNQGNNYIVLGDYDNGVISTWANGVTPISINGGSESTSVNAWHHIAFTWDGGSEKIYLDGVMVKSAATTGTLSPSGENFGLKIGSRFSGNAQFVHGLIDNVRISNVALAANQLGYFTDSATGAVPEPATWAMMLVGFGMVGGALRRRQVNGVRIRYA